MISRQNANKVDGIAFLGEADGHKGLITQSWNLTGSGYVLRPFWP